MYFEHPQADYLYPCVLGVDQTLSPLISEISCSQIFKKANHLENQVRNLILAIISRMSAIQKYIMIMRCIRIINIKFYYCPQVNYL